MEKITSKVRPSMNIFFERLRLALQNLPNNPKPECGGFCLAFYKEDTGVTTCESLGFIPDDKKFKYNYYAQKKCAQTLFLKKNRSKEFEHKNLEQFPGGIKIGKDCAGVSGHDSMVDEAIAAVFIFAYNFQQVYGESALKSEHFSKYLLQKALVLKSAMPDNQWPGIIVELIAAQDLVS